MRQKMEILRREWNDCIRMMRREHRKLEEKMHEQSSEIAELRSAITLLTCHRKATMIPHLPAIRVTGNAVRVNARDYNHSSTARSPQSVAHREGRNRGTNLSLPRLAPLHTHMSLSRNSGHYSGQY